MCRMSAPDFNECLSTSQVKLSEDCSVVPIRTALVEPLDPGARNPGMANRARPNVYGCPETLPFGRPSSLFLATPKSAPNRKRSYLFTPTRSSFSFVDENVCV